MSNPYTNHELMLRRAQTVVEMRALVRDEINDLALVSVKGRVFTNLTRIVYRYCVFESEPELSYCIQSANKSWSVYPAGVAEALRLSSNIYGRPIGAKTKQGSTSAQPATRVMGQRRALEAMLCVGIARYLEQIGAEIQYSVARLSLRFPHWKSESFLERMHKTALTGSAAPHIDFLDFEGIAPNGDQIWEHTQFKCKVDSDGERTRMRLAALASFFNCALLCLPDDLHDLPRNINCRSSLAAIFEQEESESMSIDAEQLASARAALFGNEGE